MKTVIKMMVVGVVFCLVLSANATTGWTGAAGSTDWTDPANWDSGVPNTVEDIWISADGINGIAVLSTAATTGEDLGVGMFTGGTSMLTITDTGSISLNKTVAVGNSAGATGTLTVDGGSIIVGADPIDNDYIHVGNSGNGTLNIINGGTVLGKSRVYTGYSTSTTGSGAINIDGNGSTLTVEGDYLLLGRNGTGTLDITDGGKVYAAVYCYIGYNGDGTATVDGSGSLLNVDTSLYVGAQITGDGMLTITGGGLVSAVNMYIDAPSTSGEGVVRIGINGALAVGDNGTTATTITEFLALVVGTDNIDYWNGTAWADITSGTLGIDYALTEYDYNSVSYTKLTQTPPKGTLIIIQ